MRVRVAASGYEQHASEGADCWEALRIDGAAVSGRMSADWDNCELRVLRVGWGPAPLRQGDTDELSSVLWAQPAEPGAWHPGTAPRLRYRSMLLQLERLLCTADATNKGMVSVDTHRRWTNLTLGTTCGGT